MKPEVETYLQNGEVLLETAELLVLSHPEPSSKGHALVLSKEQYPILEHIPDALLGKLFAVANTLSSSLFDTLGAKGTTLFIQNGIPAGQHLSHVMLHVVPRYDNDGISLQWDPRQMSEEEMATIELKYKEEMNKSTQPASSSSTPEVISSGTSDSDNASHESSDDVSADNYLLRQIDRVP